MLHDDLLRQAEALAEPITALRRAIHAEPELGLQTPLTRDKVLAACAHLPLTWREGPSTTGLVATLKGEAGAKDVEPRRVLLRGDMDALEMPEETGVAFASTIPGRMHACGHDAHTAMLAGAAELLSARRADFAGEVQFMFQPGEEGFHGARFMIEDGLLEPRAQAAFALHIMPNSPHGMIAGRAGPLLASADRFEITVAGAGGHASMPHDARDPVPVACEIVSAIQTMVTRRFSVADPVVATVAKITAGTAYNVIPDTAHLLGTIRTLSAASRARLHEELASLAEHIAAAHGLSATTVIVPGFPVTVCDARAVDLGEAAARQIAGEGRFQRLSHPIMGAEDFAYVLDVIPGAMFFLGVAHEGADWKSCCSIHSTRMMIDESVMPMGAAMLAGCATRFLAQGFG